MNPQPASVEPIFLEAVEKTSPDERDAFLDQACAGDAALRQRVEALLKAHTDAGSFLSTPAFQAQSCETAVLGHRGPDRTPFDEGPREESLHLALEYLDPPRQSGHLGALGPYEITAVIGQGGMGVVFKAHDPRLNRVVAIKVLAPALASNAAARKRFIREAQAAAAVTHDHVITIHAIEEVKNLPLLVMQYVAGQSLQQKLDSTGPLEVKQVVRIGRQVAAGLAAAHEQGLIHRDIKPSNILLENGVERVKITDFGLARAVDDATLTQTGAVAGTPQYMSPEQAQGHHVDHRADLFSLGSVLYAMCTGQAPFEAETSMAVLKRVCEDTPRAIAEINPDVPDDLVNIIAKLHAKNPAERFQSAGQVAKLLEHHLAHPSQKPPRRPALHRAPDGEARWPLRRRWTGAAVAVLILAGAIIAIPQIIIRIKDQSGKVTTITVPAGSQVEIEERGKSADDVPRRANWVGEIRRFEGHTDHVWSVAFHPDGRRALSGGWDNTIRLWNVNTGQELRRFLGHTSGVCKVVFSRDGRRLLSAGGRDKTMRLWDVETGEELRRFEGHTAQVWCVDLSPDGRLALSGGGRHGGTDFAIRVWDVDRGEELRRLEGHEDDVMDVAFSPDGRQALSCSGRLVGDKPIDIGIRLWDVETGEELRRFVGHTNRVGSVVFSRDGRRALSGSFDGTVRFWDVDSGQELRRFVGHRGSVGRVAFSPDGRRALAGGTDRSVLLWDVETASILQAFKGHTDIVESVAFSPDGRRALSGAHRLDGTMRLWQLPP